MKTTKQSRSGGSSLTTCSPRYSFRLPDGSLPINNGKLSWVGNVDQAMKDAESWGATHLVVLHQRDDSEKWFITDEIPLENAGGMVRELAAQDSESPTKQNG
jgi:hypothetical protein